MEKCNLCNQVGCNCSAAEAALKSLNKSAGGACPTCGCNLELLAKALPSMEGFQSLAAKPKAPTPAAAGAAKEISGAKFSGGAKPGTTGVKTVNSELKNFQSLKKSKVKLPGCK